MLDSRQQALINDYKAYALKHKLTFIGATACSPTFMLLLIDGASKQCKELTDKWLNARPEVKYYHSEVHNNPIELVYPRSYNIYLV